MHAFVPVIPAFDKRFRRVVVAGPLQVQDLVEQLTHDFVVTVVIDGQQSLAAARFA